MRALKYVLIACVGVFALVISLVGLLITMPLRPFENAIATAFNGKTELGPGSRYAVVCAGFDCDDVLPLLPPVSSVECSTSIVGDSLPKWDVPIVGVGACCLAQFGELGRAEVHIYRGALRYTILLAEPRMRDVVKALVEQP